MAYFPIILGVENNPQKGSKKSRQKRSKIGKKIGAEKVGSLKTKEKIGFVFALFFMMLLTHPAK